MEDKRCSSALGRSFNDELGLFYGCVALEECVFNLRLLKFKTKGWVMIGHDSVYVALGECLANGFTGLLEGSSVFC